MKVTASARPPSPVRCAPGWTTTRSPRPFRPRGIREPRCCYPRCRPVSVAPLHSDLAFVNISLRWLKGTTDSMDPSLSKLWEMVRDRKPGELQPVGSQRVGHDRAAERQQRHLNSFRSSEPEWALHGLPVSFLTSPSGSNIVGGVCSL